MPKFEDLTGRKFHRLTVAGRAENYVSPKGYNLVMWNCVCECGNKSVVGTAQLKSGKTKSCGCYNKENIEKRKKVIIGEKYNRLTVIDKVERKERAGRSAHWVCICDCGKKTIVDSYSLTSGRTKSCGCYAKDARKHSKITEPKHGMTHTRIYTIWYHRRARTSDRATGKDRVDYYERGIRTCPEWDNLENGFENFYKWAMENGYREDLTIDRIDNDGNYEPSNCRWADDFTQARNKRIKKTNKTGYSGVYEQRPGRYRVTIRIDGKNTTIGHYDSLEDAVIARRDAELKYWGHTNIDI